MRRHGVGGGTVGALVLEPDALASGAGLEGTSGAITVALALGAVPVGSLLAWSVATGAISKHGAG